MESERFDQFARGIAAARSRRELLKFAIGGALAGVAGIRLKSQAHAQAACDPPCEGETVCNAVGECVAECQQSGLCDNEADCCFGYQCLPAGKGGSACDALCLPESAPCDPQGVACCSELGLECIEGTCAAPQVCIPEGNTCDPGDDQCCGELECTDLGQGPICFACIQEGQPCETIGCCQGLVCNETMTACVPICSGVGETCEGFEDCCQGLQCAQGICQDCSIFDEQCEVDADCCEFGEVGLMLTCQEGLCRYCALTGFEETCTETIECCDPADVCDLDTGTCVSTGCKSDKDCPQDTCCCHDGSCSATCCDTGGCRSDKDCPKGTCCCSDGSCSAACCSGTTTTSPPSGEKIDTLPSTGTGPGSPAGLAYGAAAVAAAAAAASRLIKKQEPNSE